MQGRTADAQGPAEALGSPSGHGSKDVLAACSHSVTVSHRHVLAAGNHGVTVSHRRANAAVSTGGDSRSRAENDALSPECVYTAVHCFTNSPGDPRV